MGGGVEGEEREGGEGELGGVGRRERERERERERNNFEIVVVKNVPSIEFIQ